MKPNLRQRPWARIVVGLVCVLALTLLAACGSQVLLLAQGGAFRTNGSQQMRQQAAQTLAMEYTQDVVDQAYDLSVPPEESTLNHVVEKPNFFYVIKDESGNEIASGGQKGEAQASCSEYVRLDNGERSKVVRQTFDTEREMQEYINKLYQTYDDVQIREQYSADDDVASTEDSTSESPTSSTYYGLVAECITYGDERFVEVTGSLLSDMVSEGYAYETLDNLSTLLAQSSTLVAGTIFGGVLALLCLLFLLWPDPVWPGVEEETDEAGDLPGFCRRRPWLDRAVPTDVLVIVAGIVLLCCTAALSDDLNYQFMPGNTIAAALVGSLIFLPTLCSLVRRGREGALGENLLFRRILHPFGRFFRWMGGGIRETVQKLPLFWQAGLLFVGFGFLELLCLLGVWNSGAGMALLWLLLKVVELIFFIRLVLQLIHLQEGGQKLTQGDLNYQLPL